jgi:pimeloyl-ACP methyl ester carboxylesterase
MADQVTTIASFPAGFATLAGLVYAVVATPQHVWSHTCWSKIRLRKSPKMVHPEYEPERILGDINVSQTTGFECLCYKFARRVTKSLQGFYKVRRSVDQDKELREQIAALHLLMWHRKFTTPATGQNIATQSTVLSSAGADTIQMSTIGSTHEVHEPSTGPDTAIGIIVNIVNHRYQPVTTVTETNRTVHLTRTMLRKLVDQAEIDDPMKSDIDIPRYFDASTERRLPKEIFAQAAAPWDVLITEVGFKGIEILFAAGIVLGSSGGAWLGLTMASIFPQRVAAGLYASSFSQVAAPPNMDGSIDRYTEQVFVATGTLWVNENEEDGYCIRPCLGWRWFDDTIRNTLGYVAQYVLMYLLTWYKMRLRTFFFPEGYRKTVDTVRYVVLVLEPVVLLVCFWRLTRQRKHEKLRYSLLVIYALMWATAIVCMIFGQQNFLRTYWRIEFEEVPRLVDPIASAGAVAVMHARGGRDARDVSHGQWGLIWAIGVCTAVW